MVSPAAIAAVVAGSGHAGRGPGGGGATGTRPARSPPRPESPTPAPPAGGGPRGRSAAAGRAHRSGRRVPLCPLAVDGLGAGDGQEGVRQQRQGDVAVPARPPADLVVVQADLTLGLLKALLDGLITNGKFCCTRQVRMDLTWWHRPLRLRGLALQADAALQGASHGPDLDRLPPAQPASRRRPPVGSGLSAAGALGRTRRPVPAGADRRGGA
jgi:hypothetical protein